jgi:hypothetical protein
VLQLDLVCLSSGGSSIQDLNQLHQFCQSHPFANSTNFINFVNR